MSFEVVNALFLICFFSGEKTSTQEWPSFLEIKGRVRLDAFEKFLKELPLSRSRAIMVSFQLNCCFLEEFGFDAFMTLTT